jgi:hypothetical protein
MPCPLAKAAEAVEGALSMVGCFTSISIDARAARRAFVVSSGGDMLRWVLALGSIVVAESH